MNFLPERDFEVMLELSRVWIYLGAHAPPPFIFIDSEHAKAQMNLFVQNNTLTLTIGPRSWVSVLFCNMFAWNTTYELKKNNSNIPKF